MKNTFSIARYMLAGTMAAIAMMTLSPDACAKPARRGVIATYQPDGTQINVTMTGDESSAIVLSEDGYLLMADESGRWCYATLDAKGMPIASQYAPGVMTRSSDTYDFLKTINKENVIAAYTEMRAEMPRRTVLPARPAFLPDDMPLTRNNIGLFDTGFPSIGTQKALVILVEFADKKFVTANANDFFKRQLNEKGFSDHGATGSARDWFIENSMGQFTPQFDVYGPIAMPKEMAYYGANSFGSDVRPEEMVVTACELLDSQIDFSQYDRDHDGIVDNIYVIYAGYGEADSGIANTIWPHSWYITKSYAAPYLFDGVRVDRYACSNEVDFTFKRPDGIGTFVHEFSHVMGLPDLYATDNNRRCFTPGSYSALDYGPYNNEGRTPPNYSIYERTSLGWLKPEPLRETRTVTVKNITTNTGYVIYSDSEYEFFLFENRQQEGNDKFIPGHGMLVWHIDYNPQVWNDNVVNNTSGHQYVDLVEADYIQSENTRAGDPFPGTDKITKYTENSVPRFVTWKRKDLGLRLENIAETNGLITFNCTLFGKPGTNAVEDLYADDSLSVKLEGQVLAIDCEKDAYIYNAQGLLVAAVGSGKHAVTLPAQGLYIVKSGDASLKVIY